MRLARDGVSLELPPGWSGRIFRRPGGGTTLHAGSFALALEDGEFGDASLGAMPPGGAFLALTEYQVDGRLMPGSGLFAPARLPIPLDPSAFSSQRLAHARPGQQGAQHFATLAGRPLCLYAVLAAPAGTGAIRAGRHPRLRQVDVLLRSLRVTRPAGSTGARGSRRPPGPEAPRTL